MNAIHHQGKRTRLSRANSCERDDNPSRSSAVSTSSSRRLAALRRCFLLFFSLFWLLALPVGTSAEEIRWRHDYARAIKEANERGVPILLNIGTVECFWCKQLELRTFVVEDVARIINERCIPLKVDGNKNTYLVQALRVQSYPTLVFAAPDGSILGYKEGFVEADALKEQLTKVLSAVATPDWMQRDFDAAEKAYTARDYARSLSLMKTVLQDGKSRPVQIRARAMAAEIEKAGNARLSEIKELADKGKTGEAITALEQLGKVFLGTQAAYRGKQMLVELNAKTSKGMEDRKRLATDLFKLAREDYDNRHFLACLDRCEDLMNRFAELPEGTQASKLAAEIKENPEWAKLAADQLADRLSQLYLALADSWLKKGQPQQAIAYLERVVNHFPNTTYAAQAQGKLTRLRGAPTSTSTGERK